jgi:hypothetical protein
MGDATAIAAFLIADPVFSCAGDSESAFHDAFEPLQIGVACQLTETIN